MLRESRIEKFLDAVVRSFTIVDTPPEEYWPLKPFQMLAYFQHIVTVDIFNEITPCGLPASSCHRVTMKGKFENRRFSF